MISSGGILIETMGGCGEAKTIRITSTFVVDYFCSLVVLRGPS